MATILHVDDSSFSRIQVGKILKKEGHELLQADTGLAALELLKTQTPDIIVSDILMPEMDGVEFLRALREAGNAIPVIMVTADVQDDTRTTCIELGAVALLNKPPKEADLLAAVNSALAQGA